MRIMYITLTFLGAMVFTTTASAQLLKKVNDAGNAVTSAGNSVNSAGATINNTKDAIKGLLGGGKSAPANQAVIVITGLTYDDAHLMELKSALEKVKGVKKLITSYKEGVATIGIPFKGSISEIWDDTHFEKKSLFKLAEISEKVLLLNYGSSEENVSGQVSR